MATLKTSDDVLLEMVETLECPVCLNTIWKPPIYRCENDHIFCGDCDAKLRGEGKHCPVCRQRILGKRALAVEQMVSKLVTYKCENSGCNFLAPLTGLLDRHKHSCEFRLIDCYVCSARVTIKDLSDHLKNVHVHNTAKDFQGAGPHVKRYLTKRTQDPPLSWTSIERTGAGGARFLFFRLLFSGRYLFWVSHCQGEEENEGFDYTVSILCGKRKDQGKTFRLAKYTGLCPPIDMPLEIIKAEQSCLSVTEGFLGKALDGSGRFYCEVMVSVAKPDGNMDK